MNEPCHWGLREAAKRIRARGISCREYVEALLAHMHDLEVEVQAWARLDRERVLADAAKRDAQAAAGDRLGPLHGIPIAVKDNFDTEGIETCANSELLSGNMPTRDAVAVERLRAAGGLVPGKTAMTVFAAMDPAPTRNPWNLAHTPGGSSSGSAAAVAARMCPAALGSQTAGSVVRPAAYCGVVGLKPTYDAISRQGLIACAWSMDHVGLFARDVSDIATLFDVLALRSTELERDTANITVGIPDRYFLDADDDVARAFDQSTQLLTEAGARIVALTLPPGFEALVEAGIITMYAEMAAFHRDRFTHDRAKLPPRLSTLIEIGLTISAADYLRAQQIRRVETAVLSQLLEQVTVLVTPATPAPAPLGLDSTGDWRLNLPFSHSGHPAITVPAGLSRAGLPIGLQMVAAHSREDRLFQVGTLFQSRSDWHRRSPPVANIGAH